MCPFLGVSKKINTAAGMGGAVIDDIEITPITAPPIPAAVFIFFDTPRKGHRPKNWLNTTLLTSGCL